MEQVDFILMGTVAGIVVATIVLAYLVNRVFRRLIRRSTDILKNDPTNYQFLHHTITALVYIVGFSLALYQIPSMRTMSSSILAGAGILAVAAGFASQHALGNIISGIFIVIFKPFRIGDRLRIRDLFGTVEDITLRHTVIRDFHNDRILIPNSVISDEVIVNADFGEDKTCRHLEFGISYDSDIDRAKQIMREEVMKHPLHIDSRSPEQVMNGDPEVVVRVISLGDSSVNIRAWAWANNYMDGFVLNCDLLESIKKRFDKEGIEIPFPHRTLVQKGKPVEMQKK